MKKKIIIISIIVIAILGLGIGGYFLFFYSNDERHVVTFEGEEYIEKKDVLNILLLGIDLRGQIYNKNNIVGENGQSDMMCVLSLDKKSGDVSIISIPREAMVEIDTGTGYSSSKVEKQICLQYNYAKTPEEGALLSKKSVEDLLNIHIDYYVAMSMGGIVNLIKDIGGVDVTMSNDYHVPVCQFGIPTENILWYDKNTTVHLDGSNAYDFVHYRDIADPNSSLERVSRQKDFFNAFVSKVKNLLKEDLSLVTKLVKDLDGYYITDIPMSEYVNLAKMAMDANISKEIVKQVPGQMTEVNEVNQFIVDKKGLIEMLIPFYFEKKGIF